MFDFTRLGLRKDQNVLVTSTKGKFYGKFMKISMNGMRLDLGEVKDMNASRFAFKFFFQKDVLAVQILDEQDQELTVSTSSDTNSSSHSRLSPKQLKQITETIDNRVFIQQADSKYAEALLDISRQYVIGISAEGTSKGRIYNMHLLAISTVDKIYIFDVIVLDAKKMMHEMKEIFESNEIMKVVYDCRGVKDNFKVNFNIELETFDLMLIAAQSYPKPKVITLSNCVEAVLGVKYVVNDHEISLKRPITRNALETVTVKIAFHIAIYHKLVQKNFFDRFKQQTENLAIGAGGICDVLEGLSGRQLMSVLNEESLVSGVKPIDYSIYNLAIN